MHFTSKRRKKRFTKQIRSKVSVFHCRSCSSNRVWLFFIFTPMRMRAIKFNEEVMKKWSWTMQNYHQSTRQSSLSFTQIYCNYFWCEVVVCLLETDEGKERSLSAWGMGMEEQSAISLMMHHNYHSKLHSFQRSPTTKSFIFFFVRSLIHSFYSSAKIDCCRP